MGKVVITIFLLSVPIDFDELYYGFGVIFAYIQRPCTEQYVVGGGFVVFYIDMLFILSHSLHFLNVQVELFAFFSSCLESCGFPFFNGSGNH